MLERFKALIDRRRDLNEVDRLSSEELDDVGLSREELRMLVRTPVEVTDRQMEMARRFGLTREDFDKYRHDYATAVATCTHCSAVGDCRAFLADKEADAIWADFCPNRDLYDGLAAGDR
jgi:uncharacterized protein YjiS (DUF1127 family)